MIATKQIFYPKPRRGCSAVVISLTDDNALKKKKKSYTQCDTCTIMYFTVRNTSISQKKCRFSSRFRLVKVLSWWITTVLFISIVTPFISVGFDNYFLTSLCVVYTLICNHGIEKKWTVKQIIGTHNSALNRLIVKINNESNRVVVLYSKCSSCLRVFFHFPPYEFVLFYFCLCIL